MAELLYANGPGSGDLSALNPTNATWEQNGIYAGPDFTTGNNTPWTHEWPMGDPSGNLSATANAQSITVYVQKTTHSTDPSVTSITVKDGTTTIASFTTGWTISGNTTIGPLTWTGSGSIDETNINVEVVTTTGGGSPTNRASVRIDAIHWSADVAAAPTGPVIKVHNGTDWTTITGVVKVHNGTDFQPASISVL